MPDKISLTQLLRGLPESLNACSAAEYRSAIASLKKQLAIRASKAMRAKAKLLRAHNQFFGHFEACQRIDRQIAKLEAAHTEHRKGQ